MLFVSDRDALFGAVHSLRDGTAATVEAVMMVRPRERRPRRLRVIGRRLEHDLRCVWFLQEPAADRRVATFGPVRIVTRT